MKTKLNPQVKEIWTKALKSGDYEQGQGALCREGKYCCLGVLCDLHRIKVLKKGKKKAWKRVNRSIEYLDKAAVLPEEVARWAFPTADVKEIYKFVNPDVKHDNGSCLAELNDDDVSFEEIASVIEEQL